MSKQWEIDARLLDPEEEPIKACFDFGSRKILDDGKLRFEFIVRTEIGDIAYRGLRYDPATDQLLLPSYRAGKGYQQYMRIDGELYEGLREKAKELFNELVEVEPAEPVEAEAVEATN
jgi:hypothetical protein